MSVRVFAPAKVNLTLEVGRPRADGLHPLQSAVMFASVGDWIGAAPAERLTLDIDGPFSTGLGADGSNLVLRAARALAEAASMGEAGARIRLSKHLPIASGIGGGSSDAAATLKALNALWDVNLPEQRLYEIARGLGADVPVCVFARPAFMFGAGDTFTPMTAPNLHAVLINPGVPLPTGGVYARFDAMALGGAFSEHAAPAWPDAETALADCILRGNDLDAPARSLAPALNEITACLRGDARVRYFGLSGSGATMFALVDTEGQAKELAARVLHQRPDWWVEPAQLAGA